MLYVSWDRGAMRHAPVPARPYLSRFNAALVDTPVHQAAAPTAEDAGGCVCPPRLAAQ